MTLEESLEKLRMADNLTADTIITFEGMLFIAQKTKGSKREKILLRSVIRSLKEIRRALK